MSSGDPMFFCGHINWNNEFQCRFCATQFEQPIPSRPVFLGTNYILNNYKFYKALDARAARNPSGGWFLPMAHQPGKSTSIGTNILAFVDVLNERCPESDRHKSPALYKHLDLYYAEVLKQFTVSQRLSDTKPHTPVDIKFVDKIPEASYIWAKALKNKIDEAKNKKALSENMHWDPYSDY